MDKNEKLNKLEGKLSKLERNYNKLETTKMNKRNWSTFERDRDNPERN